MRSIRIALVAALAVLAPVLAGAPAQAGGPTSVMIVAPGQSRTAALYYDDAEYIRLNDVVQRSTSGAGMSQPPAGSSTGDDPGITLTWLLHDVMVWRVDRVYFHVAGGPWIATTTDIGGSGERLSAAPVWHRVEDGKELDFLLAGLGVRPGGGVAASPSAPALSAVDPDPTAGPVSPVRPAGAAADGAGSAWTGWWWGPAGLLLGAGGVLALQRRRPARPQEAGDDTAGSWDAELDEIGPQEHRVPARGA